MVRPGTLSASFCTVYVSESATSMRDYGTILFIVYTLETPFLGNRFKGPEKPEVEGSRREKTKHTIRASRVV